MTPYNIAVLFCRLLSIWCVARFVETFAQTVAQIFAYVMSSPTPTKTPLLTVVSFAGWPLGLIMVSCILWIAAPSIAKAATRNIEYSNYESPVSNSASLFAVGQGLLGLYFVALGLSSLASGTVSRIVSSLGIDKSLVIHLQGAIVASVLHILIGAFLLFLARNVLKREADSSSSQNKNENSSL